MEARDPRRSFIWLPDDDLLASTCNITRLLSLMERQRLLLAQVQGASGGAVRQRAAAAPDAEAPPAPNALAQMSVCPTGNTSIAHEHLFQQPGTALRYTTL